MGLITMTHQNPEYKLLEALFQSQRSSEPMGIKLKVLNGTPIHEGISLCDTCTEAHRVKGTSFSHNTTTCMVVYSKPREINFRVTECSSYNKINDPDLKEMKQIGWVLATRKGRVIGFLNPTEAKAKEADGSIDEEENSNR